ncbi:MAG: Lnb N-terminal periplasmic domain-containing protein [Xanthobacteraceae bacterium]
MGLFLGVVAWWLSISPSHDRPWRPEVAVMPQATVDGDRVRITGVRNFEYRGLNDFTVRYEERELQLSHLTGLDFFVSYWSEGLVGHTFLSFIFDNAPPLSISIETRPELGQSFDPVGSLFKQFDLIYVVGDERDVVRVRTNYRKETVYLYRLNSSPDDVRRLFMVYLKRINELADRPEFYHLLSNSCTINIIRYLNAAGRAGRFDIRHVFNGLIDNYLYYSGRMDTTLPFAEVRRRSLINEAAQAADDAPDFSGRIRATLPTMAR